MLKPFFLAFCIIPAFASSKVYTPETEIIHTPEDLQAAVTAGDTVKAKKLIEALIKQGYNFYTLNTQDFKSTLLEKAVEKRDLSMARLLVGAGADIGITGGYPMLAACRGGSVPVVQYLLSIGAELYGPPDPGLNALHYAVIGGNLDMVKYLVEKQGMDVNEASVYGETPLMYAAGLPIVKYLTEKGADIHAVNEPGASVLDCAKENKEIYNYLKKLGAKSSQE